MALIKFIKASEPPVTWLADALYFIKNNGYAETWVTSAGGTPEEVGNSQMIAAVAGSLKIHRFGVDDNTSDVNRSMDMQLHDFVITNATNLHIESKTFGSSNGLSLTPTQVQLYVVENVSGSNETTSINLTGGAANLARPGQPTSSLVTLADVQKNIPNGYAGLDANTKIPASLLPAYVDDVLEYPTRANFPATGTSGVIYVATDTNKTYRWSGSTYVDIVASVGSTDSVPEGSVNLYYSDARVAGVLTSWPGSSNINTVGTIGGGTWRGTPVADNYIASASAWNAKQNALGFTPENPANKNVANGYAGLDSAAKIPSALLPAYVDDVLEFATLSAFPATGTTGIIYVAIDTNRQYRWSGSAYVELVASPGSTDNVPEGSLNKYYLDSRVNTFLTTWTGNTAINKVGTIGTGIWQGTAITDTYIASAATWNAKADKTTLPSTRTASLTLALADAGTLLVMNNTGNATVTIPLNSSVAFPIGTSVNAISINTGLVTFAATAGVTILSADGALNLRTLGASGTAYKAGTDTWYVWGDLI
jgi:hypothetical protein